MTEKEAITIWLPIIAMGVESMPECSEALGMAIAALERENETAEWLNGKCSACGCKFKLDINGMDIEFEQASTRFCPNCGTKMRVNK